MARPPKAAVVVIIDIGRSESLTSYQNSEFLKKSRECASMIIQRKIFSSPKDEVCVIHMGSNDSDNSLYDGESYANISILLPLQESNWEGVRRLNAVSSESDIHADWLEAVAVALNYLRTESNQKKFGELRIVLFTANLKNGTPENLSLIEDDMKGLKADLIVLYPHEVDETEVEMAKEIVEQVNGSLFDLEGAMVQLMQFQKKVTKPQAWNVSLDIGSKIQIPVTGYKKINDSQKFAWKTCSASDVEGKVLVEREVSYRQSEKVNVPKSDVVDGYKYGSTLVPFTESDRSQLGYVSGPKCLSVLNVTKEGLVPRHIWLGNSATLFVARKNDQNATAAFSALVQALSRLNSVAIVRRVYNNGNRPRLGALIPCVKTKKEYLMYVELPFSHDLRHCLLPELKPQNLKQEQLDAVDKLMDSMDLSVPIEVEGTPEEDEELIERDWNGELIPHQILDPYMQHVRRCISQKILHPEKPLPDPDPEILETLVEPLSSLKEAAADAVKEVLKLFPGLETLPSSKVYGKRNAPANTTEESKKDSNEDEVAAKKVRGPETEYVGPLNPLEDFQAAIGLKMVSFLQVCQQMQNVIQQLVLSSFGKEHFDKPHQCLKLLRKNILSEHENKEVISSFNDWMKDFKVKLQENLKMGFWQLIKEGNLGIINCKECSESSITLDEANIIMGNSPADIKDEFEDDDDDMDIGDLVETP